MKNVLSLLLTGMLTLFLFQACKDKKDHKAIPTDCTDIHWTYSGEEGPDHWDHLCTGYADCGGKSQSPVNITGVQPDSSLSPLMLNYKTTPVEIKNNGHTIEFACNEGNKLSINGTDYELLQFHFHGLSEHQVDGQHFPLEVHFVNKAADDNYAVIGVFFEEGTENPLFTSFMAHFPTEKGTYEDPSSEIDLSGLFPTDISYYNYSGSLTTPPCSEVVNWYVLKNTVTASASQLSEFQKLLHNNYRPVQELNGRTISEFIQ